MLDVEQSMEEMRGRHSGGLKRLSTWGNAGSTNHTGPRRACFSFAAYARNVIEHLKKCNVPVAKGLSGEEFVRVEAAFGFTFPPDLKGILEEGLPVGVGFPDWRTGDSQQLRTAVNSPIAGILHEVGRGKLWWKDWGPRPTDAGQAVTIARTALREFSVLVPIFSQCYIPCSPNLPGNPVFFLDQTEVVYCGYDVTDFFEREVFLSLEHEPLVGRDLLRESVGSSRGQHWDEAVQDETKGDDSDDRDLNSVPRSSSASGGTDSSQTSGSGKSEWSAERLGHNLEFLAKFPEAFLDRQRKSFVSFDGGSMESDDSARNGGCQDDSFSHYNMHKSQVSSETGMMHSSTMIPPWAAKTPRQIEFWSELAEKQDVINAAGPTEGLFPAYGVEKELIKPTTKPVQLQVDRNMEVVQDQKDVVWGDQTLTDFHNILIPQWLTGYLEEISVVLRKGGWKEHDISDMMDTKPLQEQWNEQLDAQAVLEGLARQVELLSTSWRQAVRTVSDL